MFTERQGSGGETEAEVNVACDFLLPEYYGNKLLPLYRELVDSFIGNSYEFSLVTCLNSVYYLLSSAALSLEFS